MNHPGAWEGVLLALAAFRVTRIIGWDTITEPIRIFLTGAPDDAPASKREGLAEWLRCPWCQGFWTSLVWWLAWWAWPTWTVAVAVPFAISATVGLVAKQLDP